MSLLTLIITLLTLLQLGKQPATQTKKPHSYDNCTNYIQYF
jgi:hypothetical protein